MKDTEKYNKIFQLGAQLASDWNELVRSEVNSPIAPTPNKKTGKITFSKVPVVALNKLNEHYSERFEKSITLPYDSQNKAVIISYEQAVKFCGIDDDTKKHEHKQVRAPQQPGLASQGPLVQNRRSPPNSPPTKTPKPITTQTRYTSVHTQLKAPPRPIAETALTKRELVNQLKSEIDQNYAVMKTWGQSLTQTIFCGLLGSGIVPNHIKQLKNMLDTLSDDRDIEGTYRFQEIDRILTHANPDKHRARRSEDTQQFYKKWQAKCNAIKQAPVGRARSAQSCV